MQKVALKRYYLFEQSAKNKTKMVPFEKSAKQIKYKLEIRQFCWFSTLKTPQN